MGWRGSRKNYCWPGTYHITINVLDRKQQPLGHIEGDVNKPDHLHFIVVVHRDIVSSNGRKTHLGQVIAGFKKGCNRRYWALTGQTGQEWQGEPATASLRCHRVDAICLKGLSTT